MKAAFYSIIGFLLMAVAVAGYDVHRTFLSDNIVADSPSGGVVKIDKGADYSRVCSLMAGSGVLRDTSTFLRAARVFKLKVKFHPGYYVFTPGMDNRAIVRTLAYGLQKPVNVVIGENLKNVNQVAGLLSRQIDCDSISLCNIMNDSTVLARYGFTRETFPAMFIPNTYEVYWTISPDGLLTKLYREYDKFWKGAREETAAAMGFSRNEISTLASIVICETRKKSEMPIVAGVYINRLHRKMPLQADPTVRFAIGVPVTRVLNSHLAIDSPYNTYKNTGLPPGPIVIPPIVAIDAVLNYSHHKYIYFCASPSFDGTHNFSVNYSDHMHYAAQYHAAFERLMREKALQADSLAREGQLCTGTGVSE